MNLIGLNDRIGVVAIGSIASQELLAALKTIPEGNAVATLKLLPQNILSQVCTQGVNDKITAYIPIAVVGVGMGLVVGFSTDSFMYGILAAALAGGLVYYLRPPTTETA